MPDLHFHTQVSGQHDGVHYIRNYPLTELVGKVSYPAAVYYMVTGIMPDEAQEKILNAILVASMDHGVGPSSGFVPRVVASTGNGLVHSMAAGLMALGPYHGLAIAEAAETIAQVRDHGIDSLDKSHFEAKKRIMGLGHPHYKHSDPRTEQLFALAKELGVSSQHQEIMFEIQKRVYEKMDKHLVINIDAAIAALLLDLGFPPEAGNGLFALARCGGMIAHVLEERHEKPVRRIEETDVVFELPQGGSRPTPEKEE